MTRPPSRPTIETAAPTTSPDALSRASADKAPGFARSVCRARFRSNPVAAWSIAAIASMSAAQQLLRISIHAGGQGIPADAPKPEIDPTKGSLDHFAINLAPYDAKAVTEYLTAAGHAPYAQGRRYGADGDGYSIYLTDPEGTVVELKSGN